MNARPSLNFPTSILVGGLNESSYSRSDRAVEKLRRSEEMHAINMLLNNSEIFADTRHQQIKWKYGSSHLFVHCNLIFT